MVCLLLLVYAFNRVQPVRDTATLMTMLMRRDPTTVAYTLGEATPVIVRQTRAKTRTMRERKTKHVDVTTDSSHSDSDSSGPRYVNVYANENDDAERITVQAYVERWPVDRQGNLIRASGMAASLIKSMAFASAVYITLSLTVLRVMIARAVCNVHSVARIPTASCHLYTHTLTCSICTTTTTDAIAH